MTYPGQQPYPPQGGSVPYGSPSFPQGGYAPTGFMRPQWRPVPWHRRALGWIIDFGLQTLITVIAQVGYLANYIPYLRRQLDSFPTGAYTPGSTPTPSSPIQTMPPAMLAWGALTYVALIPWAYFVLYRRWIKGGPTGQSLGRKIAQTRLVNANTGQPIGAGMTFVRDLAHMLDSLPFYIGYLWPLWDKQRQTFADKLLTTVVVDERDAPLNVRR